MFDSYLNLPKNYVPNNLFKNDLRLHREKDCLFTIGATNKFVQNLRLCRNEIQTINEPYPNDKAVYFIFKNGVSEVFKIVADIIPLCFDTTSEESDNCPIMVKCQIDDAFLEEHNIQISSYLDFKVQLKIILVDGNVLYTAKKNIKVITSLDK